MSKIKHRKLEILDCTIRDGGYINDWYFDKKLVREVYRALAKAGVDIVEIGFHGTEKYFDKEKFGLWRFSPEKNIREVTAGINGPVKSLMVDYSKFDMEDILFKEESIIDIIRIAVHKDKVKDAFVASQKIKAKGYKVSLQLMGFSGYTKDDIRETMKILQDGEIDYVYVADSYGSVFPGQIKEFLEPVLQLNNVKVGFHPHNNLQMAFANALEAIRCGVDVVDGSIYGMGRAAGNLPIEVMLSHLEIENPDKYNVIPILNIIDKYFLDIFKENPWGYQLHYMVSAMFKVHPTYVKNILSMREYTLEDIWKIMGVIKNINPVGFKKDILEKVLERGIFSNVQTAKIAEARITEQFVPKQKKAKVGYVSRYPRRDFLVLANGPNLKKYQKAIQQFIDKYQPVVLGANLLNRLFVPHYHAFNNKRRFMDYVGTVASESKLLLGQYFSQEFIREYTTRDYEIIYYEDTLANPFDIKDGIISSNCRTISVLLSAVALVMGAKRVFIAGMDGYMDTSKDGIYHFYNEKDEADNLEDLKEKHSWNLKFLKQIDDCMVKSEGEGLHILTPTNYKEFYKGIKNYI